MTNKERIAELEEEERDSERIRKRMNEILDATANALHGGRLRHGLWSWHDLAELAGGQRRKLSEAVDYLRTLSLIDSPHGRQLGAEIDNLLNARKDDTVVKQKRRIKP